MTQPEIFNIMDGATGTASEVIQMVKGRRDVVLDSKRLLEERLEAYEDIIDSEVGDTSLVRARKPFRGSGRWWITPMQNTWSKLDGENGRSRTPPCAMETFDSLAVLARAASTLFERSTPTTKRGP